MSTNKFILLSVQDYIPDQANYSTFISFMFVVFTLDIHRYLLFFISSRSAMCGAFKAVLYLKITRSFDRGFRRTLPPVATVRVLAKKN